MAQCGGTTKAGARCKRSALEGAGFCGLHGDQAEPSAAASDSPGVAADRGTDLLLVGVVAVALFAVRRILRFL